MDSRLHCTPMSSMLQELVGMALPLIPAIWLLRVEWLKPDLLAQSGGGLWQIHLHAKHDEPVKA